MAASVAADMLSSNGDHRMDKEDNNRHQACGKAGKISSQLLYTEKYGECYQADKLSIVGKDNPASRTGQLRTFQVPQSSVMSRVRDFLPQMLVANKEMASELATNPQVADKFNIEHLGDGGHAHVEMNLSLVPPELFGDGSSSSDETDSESCSESESESDDSSKQISKPDKSLQLRTRKVKQTKPNIEVIEDSEMEISRQKVTEDR